MYIYVHVHEYGCVGRVGTIKDHHSQFSRLGIQCPTLVYVSSLMRWVFFLKIPVWLVLCTYFS